MDTTKLNDKVVFYEALIEQHRPYIIAIVSARASNKSDIDDIVQDVFLRGFKAIDTIMNHENPVGWLVRTAINVLKEYYKAERRTDRISETLIAQNREIWISYLNSDKYKEALEVLTEEELLLLKLRHVIGLSIAEICTELKHSEAKAKKKLVNARKKLRKAAKDNNLLK